MAEGAAQNVRVAVRCRPISGREERRGALDCSEFPGNNNIKLTDPDPDAKGDRVREFTFVHCYAPDSNQETVYQEIGAPCLTKALGGFNGTIFAYGQTGSGKTHTMVGSVEDTGIVPKLNHDLFERIADLSTEGTEFMITVAYLEIYNENVKDLLNPTDKKLKIRQHPDLGIYVEDLCQLAVKR
jgi:hypothetical protein